IAAKVAGSPEHAVMPTIITSEEEDAAEERRPLQVSTSVEELLKEYDRRLGRIEAWHAKTQEVVAEPSPRLSSPGVQVHAAQVLGGGDASFTSGHFTLKRELTGSKVDLEEQAELDDQHPFSRMWMNARLQHQEMFDQDLLQSIYEKSGQRARNRVAVFGGGLMGILSMPFGPIGMAAGGLFGALVGMLIGICLDRRRYMRSMKQSEIETRRLKSLVRWSAERFADEDDPLAAVQHLELVVLEFKPVADIAMASKNARRTLKLLDSWAARRSMMRQLWAYMDNILINWKKLTQADFLRKIQEYVSETSFGILDCTLKPLHLLCSAALRCVPMAAPKSVEQSSECHRSSGGYPDPYTYNGKGKAIYNPPVELPSSSASNFFEEAGAGEAEETEARRKFNKFCTQPDGSEPKAHLTYESFCRLVAHYEAASSSMVQSYFYAIDRKRDNMIDFDEFFLGVVAGDPTTVHILNSFTGRERAQFTFDFYDMNHSGLLEIEEFERVVRDCALSQLSPEQCKGTALEKAEELGLMDDRQDGGFTPPDTGKFYEFIMTERLRGTSRLFRFQKSLIKPPQSRSQKRGPQASVGAAGPLGHTGHPTALSEPQMPSSFVPAAPTAAPSQRSERCRPERSERPEERLRPQECFELPEAGHKEDPIPDLTTEEPGSEQDSEMSPYILGLESDAPSPDAKDVSVNLPPYDAYLPPAPACRIALDDSLGTADAVLAAQRVMETLSVEDFPGLMPPADGSFVLLTPAELVDLCRAVRPILAEEEMIIPKVVEPIKVFGSLHGQLCDLLSWFKWHKPPSDGPKGDLQYVNYVFLGDYADRGGYGLEVISILFSLKVLFPHRVFLLRGHHENRHVNYHLGFRQECERRLGAAGLEVFEYVNSAFDHLSLAALTWSGFLAMGPGVVPASLAAMDQLNLYQKPLSLPHPSQASELASDDTDSEQILLELFTPSSLLSRDLGARTVLDDQSLKVFCASQKLKGVIFGRQILPHGHLTENGVIRVCSCLNYCDLFPGNLASILYIMTDLDLTALIKPKVMTSFLDKHHHLSDCPNGAVPRRSSSPSRWPKQIRAPTPDRIIAVEHSERTESKAGPLVLFPAYKACVPKRARPGSTIPDGRPAQGNA
ncbi:BSL2, partial [Symbiodinium sp. KB8]